MKFEFKRMVSVAAAAVCMVSAFKLVPINQEDASAAGDLTAFQITAGMEIGWNLGNSLDSTASSVSDTSKSTETAWGNPVVTKELISAVKAKGFNTIRIPTTWYQHLDSNDNIDPAWMARVKEVVDYAYDQDMYVILNIHHEEWINRADFGTAYNEMSPRLIKIWKQIAAEFKDYDQHLVFEGMNEPRAAGTDWEWNGKPDEFEVVNKLNKDFIDTVRSIDSPYKDSRLLMIPAYCASSYESIYSYLDIPDDDHIAVSIHAYSPYEFAMSNDVDMSMHMTFTDAVATNLDNLFGSMRSYFTDKDIPVVIGEFSASNFNNTEARCDWAEYYIGITKKYGMPCVLWDNNCYTNSLNPSEAHGYINRNNNTWYAESEKVVDTMMKVINDDSIVWGSERKCPIYTHPSIDSGKTLWSSASGKSIDASVTGGNCTENYNVSWSMLENKDVAVKFTGDTPILAFMDDNWKNWTEYSPYHVENGVAYYSYESIKKGWTAATEPSHICARTNGKTTIYQFSLIEPATVIQPEVDPIEKPTENPDKPTTPPTTEPPTTEPSTVPPTSEDDSFVFETKTYDIEIPAGSKDGAGITFEIKGAAGASIGGAVGYGTNEDDWVNLEWSDKIGSDGTVSVTVDISEMPAAMTSAQIQIWWSNVWDASTESSIDKDCELTSYDVRMGDIDAVWGDANNDGELSITDAVLILSYASNPGKAKIENIDICDVYNRGDGVDGLDSLAVQKRITNVITELPESFM